MREPAAVQRSGAALQRRDTGEGLRRRDVKEGLEIERGKDGTRMCWPAGSRAHAASTTITNRRSAYPSSTVVGIPDTFSRREAAPRRCHCSRHLLLRAGL